MTIITAIFIFAFGGALIYIVLRTVSGSKTDSTGTPDTDTINHDQDRLMMSDVFTNHSATDHHTHDTTSHHHEHHDHGHHDHQSNDTIDYSSDNSADSSSFSDSDSSTSPD